MKLSVAMQTCGSLVVFGAFAASEAAAWCLDAWPGSATAWYLNLEIFRPFEAARAAPSPLRHLFGPSALGIDMVLLTLVLTVSAVRHRLGIAVFANLAFIAAAMLSYAWWRAPAAQIGAAGSAFPVPRHVSASEPDILMLVLLAASFAAFAYSHVGFALAIRRAA